MIELIIDNGDGTVTAATLGIKKRDDEDDAEFAARLSAAAEKSRQASKGVSARMRVADDAVVVQESERVAASRRVPPPINRRRFFQQLKKSGIITHGEFLAAATMKAVPRKVADSLDGLVGDDRDDAEAVLLSEQQFHRDDPLIARIGIAIGYTKEQLDELWRAAANL